jgi:hypothetical protein
VDNVQAYLNILAVAGIGLESPPTVATTQPPAEPKSAPERTRAR